MSDRSPMFFRRSIALVMPPFLALALTCGFAPSASAGFAQVGTRAFAQDVNASISGSQTLGAQGSAPPYADATSNFSAGQSLAFSYAAANAIDGSLHVDALASVSAAEYLVGRNAASTASASITGAITLSSAPLPPGLATFTLLIEGGYTFNNSPFNYQNDASLSYDALIGDVSYSGAMIFVPSSQAGLIGVPLTFTMMVTPGESIYMAFDMITRVGAAVGQVEVKMLNTMKLTGISLPAGYSYTSDADGFLSTFASPVPEPGTAATWGAGLLGLGYVFGRRTRRQGVGDRGRRGGGGAGQVAD